MRIALIDSLVCPYCGGGFRLKRAVQQRDDEVIYGLVECRCFVFPIVEGILLLSLSKGYGGAEEALQPYVPLQAAAVQFLEQGQVDALQRWLERHIPLARPLVDGTAGTYLESASRIQATLDREVAAYLDEFGRYEVLGNPVGRQRRLLRGLRRRLRPAPSGRGHERAQLAQFYPARFFSPYAHATLMQLGWLPLSGKVLSLCCGHGMFENLLRADGRAADVVSIDGQFLNLLLVRRFVRPHGQFICHDVQFGLPFADEAFDAVFSSTCLPEIPAQRLFAREAVRVTRRSGWTWFDCIWNGEAGGARILRNRFYRFAQNFFGRLEDYPAFFAECAGGRAVGIHVPTQPRAYVDEAPRWSRAPAEIEDCLKARAEIQISALIGTPEAVTPKRAWASAGMLGPSPAFDAARQGADVELTRRPGFDALAPTFAPKAFGSYPARVRIAAAQLEDPAALLDAYCRGALALLPANFDRGHTTLAGLRGT